MKNNLTAKQSIMINAPASSVWNALVNPAKIKQYLFGTDVISVWKPGSPILYRGEWKGTKYEDKGVITAMVPERLFESTYWSSMSGLEDVPENYMKVSYRLEPANKGTIVTVTQDNSPSEESRNHSEQNWKTVLEGLRNVVESEFLVTI